MVTVSNSFFENSIFNRGTLTVTNSTFFRARIDSDGMLTVTNSAFFGLDNDFGIGIDSDGLLTVTNSTFFVNTGKPYKPPMILSEERGTLTVTNSTVSGGLIVQMPCSVGGPPCGTTLRNTIVANGCRGPAFDGGPNIGGGPIIDGGHNLDVGTTCGFSTANGSLSNTDPQLDPAGPQNNGGPAQTVALCRRAGTPAGCRSASPTIDAGDDAVCAAAPVSGRDQRGAARPGTGHTHCSIGAFEAGSVPAVTTLTLKDNASKPARKSLTVTSKDAAIGAFGGGAGSGDDPTVNGGTLRIVSVAGGFDDTYAMPKSGWTYIGNPTDGHGYRYRDAKLVNGPVKAATLRKGVLQVSAKGAGLGQTLGSNPDPVSVVLQTGAKRYCTSFGTATGATTKFMAGKQFRAKDAAAPATCPP